MDLYPTTTLAEKTGLRASIAREQVWGFVLRFVFGLNGGNFRLFFSRRVDIEFGAELIFDGGKELLELGLGFGNFVALALDLTIEVVNDIVLFGDLTIQAIDDVVLFVYLFIE